MKATETLEALDLASEIAKTMMAELHWYRKYSPVHPRPTDFKVDPRIIARADQLTGARR